VVKDQITHHGQAGSGGFGVKVQKMLVIFAVFGVFVLSGGGTEFVIDAEMVANGVKTAGYGFAMLFHDGLCGGCHRAEPQSVKAHIFRAIN